MDQDKVEFTSAQFAITLFAVTVGTVYFPAAGILTPLAGTAAWIAILLAFALSLLWAWMAVVLCRWAPKGDFPTAVFHWLGPWIGRLLLLQLLVIGLWLGSLLLLQGSLVFHDIALTATPPLALTLSALALAVATDLKGVEVYSRSVQLLFFVSIPLMLSFYVATIPSFKVASFLPLWGEGAFGITQACLQALPWPMEGCIFTLFLGCMVKKQDRLGKHALAAIVFAGLAIATITMATLNELGQTVCEAYIYPATQLLLSTNLGSFFQGLELFIYPIWLITSYIKATALFMLASASLRGLWPGLRQPWRALLLGAGFLALSLLPKDIQTMVKSAAAADDVVVASFYLLLPIVLLLAWLRRRKQGA